MAPIPNDLTGLRSLPSIWGNGFSLDRTGREPCGLVVVEGDQKTRGVRGEPLRVLFSALLSPRPDSGLCGVGRQKRPFCSTHSLCAHVWLACEPAKSESKAGQRATGKTGSVEVAQLAAARFFFFFFALPEMVTSTQGILLLPMLICLQRFVNVHGKSRATISFVCACVCIWSHRTGETRTLCGEFS